MLPLVCEHPPTDFDSLAAAFLATMEERVAGADLASRLTVVPATWPTLTDVTVDLTGATLKSEVEKPVPVDLANLDHGFAIKRLVVHGEPLTFRDAQICMRSTSDELSVSFARDEQQRLILVPTNVQRGETSVDISNDALQTLLLEGAREAAKEHGASVDGATLTLQQSTSNAATFNTRVQARKGMLKATMNLVGRISIDDQLTLRVNDLDCRGEGMLGTMLAALVKTQIAQHNDKEIPLSDHALGDVKIEHLSFDVSEGLSVSAQFVGSSPAS